jgi:molybdopterin converting factor small subunit
MKINVKSFAHLRLALEQSPLAVDLPEGATTMDLIAYLGNHYGEAAHKAIVMEDGNTLKVTPVNEGKAVVLDEPLKEGMTIVFMSHLAGGSGR